MMMMMMKQEEQPSYSMISNFKTDILQFLKERKKYSISAVFVSDFDHANQMDCFVCRLVHVPGRSTATKFRKEKKMEHKKKHQQSFLFSRYILLESRTKSSTGIASASGSSFPA